MSNLSLPPITQAAVAEGGRWTEPWYRFMASRGGALAHFSDDSPPGTATVLGTDYQTFGYFHVDEPSTGGVSSRHSIALHVHHECKTGQVGGVTAGQFVSEYSEAPASMSGGVAALRAITSVPATTDLSSFTGAVPEGFVTSCLVGGNFAGMMIGHVAVAGAFGLATPTQRYTMMLLDEGAATHNKLGSTYDAHLVFTSAGGAGARDMILINNAFGSFPTAAGGISNILKIRGGTPAFTAGIDISSATFSGNAFASPSFTVTGAGALTAASVAAPLVATTLVMALTEIATPANPPAGLVYLYAKSDKKPYALDSNGLETALF